MPPCPRVDPSFLSHPSEVQGPVPHGHVEYSKVDSRSRRVRATRGNVLAQEGSRQFFEARHAPDAMCMARRVAVGTAHLQRGKQHMGVDTQLRAELRCGSEQLSICREQQ